VEETLKGITHLVLAHLVRKYGLEGSEPLERDIQILNASVSDTTAPEESLWDETDDTAPPAPEGEAEFELDDAGDHADAPLVPTELVGSVAAASRQPETVRGPFDDISFEPSDVPMASIEIPLPDGILESLPEMTPAPERRAADALVKEVSIPLNLSLDEIRRHRRLRLKITLDVNLLP
jgi:hypothetical protein